jgi:hypothetical protein
VGTILPVDSSTSFPLTESLDEDVAFALTALDYTAAHEAHGWLDLKYEEVISPPFNAGTRWA